MADPVRLAVMTNRLEGIVGAMMNTLFRTGRSCVLNTGRDFSCCIVTHDAELLVVGESLPVHVMSGPDMMVRSMLELHPELQPGDAFLHNSPYHGGSHAADHCLLVPVIDEGTHHFTVVAKAHQADCGNASPTTYAADARDVYEEGALIFPCVKVQHAYKDIDDIIRMCQLRIRVPEQWWGDYLALLGAVRIGERRLLELGREVGWDALRAHSAEWFDYSERRMRSAIGKLKSGRYEVSGWHDPFPGVPDGVPLRATIEVRSEEGEIDVDLTDNVDCLPCGLNLTESNSRTAAMIGVFNSIDHTVPPNAGSFRCLHVQLRENCVVGIPRHPASCSVATSNISDRLINIIQRGLAGCGDGSGMAEVGAAIPPSCAVISGRDPRTGGEPFVNQLISVALTGGAAGPSADGWLTATHAGSSGMQIRDSVEIVELRYPIRIAEQRIIPDTEGAGRFRGAPGSRSEYGPVGCELGLVYGSDGTVNPALGAHGGLSGGKADQFRRGADGTLSRLDACAYVVLGEDERIVSISAGGGGYGPPDERDPQLVASDAAEGWITRDRATSVYGVVLDDSGDVDVEATERVRAQMRGRESTEGGDT